MGILVPNLILSVSYGSVFCLTVNFQQTVNLFDVGMMFSGFFGVSDSFSSLWLVSAYRMGTGITLSSHEVVLVGGLPARRLYQHLY